MEEVLYDMMNWGAMEALVYSEHDNPHSWLGMHLTDEGMRISTYQPGATNVTVKLSSNGKKYPMEAADDQGNFSVLIPSKRNVKYTYLVEYGEGNVVEVYDPYVYAPLITPEDEERFNNGIHYEIYEKLGAHVKTVKNVSGTYFAVWAPNAQRVSVVGNFNQWDGRRHQMRRLPSSGIFEIFIPGVECGEIYKYEIKTQSGLTFLKADPYANHAEMRPANASIVSYLDYEWSDDEWLKTRKKTDFKTNPMSVYELHLGSWKRKGEGENDFCNYRKIAHELAAYVKKMGYTHVELLPIMEHPFDGSWGYQVTGYYAATSRYGTPQDFMYFVEYMHKNGIGVILDWVPAHFPRDTFGLPAFDGTCLYEHQDPRQGSHPHWGTLIFNYGRPQVSNFLIANALFWREKYHIDGIRMDAVASMLYLDYGKEDGEWVANKYGGRENLEAIELLKHLNSIWHKKKDGAVVIAEESTAWPNVTTDVDDDGLGFDLKWNMGWMNDFTGYMKQDPLFRKGCHGMLTFSMVYAYSERFMLVLSHDEVVHMKGSMINKMPGNKTEKLANLRTAYGFMTGHPGKKLLFMGQEFGQSREWAESRELDWFELDNPENVMLQNYVAELNKLYRKYPALFEQDFEPEGFKWISCMDADHSIVSFYREAKDGSRLIFACNFTPVVYENFRLAVPEAGKYKEILNSDAEKFGGSGHVNSRQLKSKAASVDGWENYIDITLPPLGIAVFEERK